MLDRYVTISDGQPLMKPENIIHYAFIDESGTTGVATGSHFLVIAVLASQQPRTLELPVRRALKKYGRRLKSGEIKAARAEESATIRMLQAIAAQDVWISAVVVNQQQISHPPKDSEEIYRQVVARAVYQLVERFPTIEICLDRRYTNEKLRYLLEKRIREGIRDLPQKMVLIRQESSSVRKGLQAADAVAWAFFQKYECNDARFYDIIAAKVIMEELLSEKDLQ